MTSSVSQLTLTHHHLSKEMPMDKQLFAIAGVDHFGKHTFIKRDWLSKDLVTTTSPIDSIYIGSNDDITTLIQECRTQFDTSELVNYIPYAVKSNVTHLDFIDQYGKLGGSYSVH